LKYFLGPTMTTATPPTIISEIQGAAKTKTRLRFSSVLMVTIVFLVAVSVLISIGILNRYFNKRVELEFQRKLHAQKGQVEILIKNRLADVQKTLADLSSDNTIRVTLLLKADAQLRERLARYVRPDQGVYPFIRKINNGSILPEIYPGISKAFLSTLFYLLPNGDIFFDGTSTRLLWFFASPIMHDGGPMGIAYVLYDLMEDDALKKALTEVVEGELAIFHLDTLTSLSSGKALPLDANKLKAISERSEYNALGDFVVSQISGSDRLYFLSSLKRLEEGKRQVMLLTGAFSILALVISMLISVYLGRKMVRPLGEMTHKAIRISEGEKSLTFETNGTFWEFDQLSQAFNTMLANLKEAEERSRYQELLENVDDAVYLIDADGRVLDANTAAYDSLGYWPEQFYGLNLEAIVPARESERIMAQLGTDESNPSLDKLCVETVHFRKDGGTIPIEIHSRPILYQGKRVILNVARDISRRIEIEKALRESEERYRSVVENSNDGIMILSEDFKILYANPVLFKILGYNTGELEGKAIQSFLTSTCADRAEEIFSGRQPAGNVFPSTIYHFYHKSGDQRAVKISAKRFTDSSGEEKIVVQLLDITEQLRIEEEKKQLEAQLVQAQKMEAIGTLAGGVAHDFNNLLMGIQGRLTMIRMQSDPEQSHGKHIDAIEKTVMSAADLTRQLLGFARKGKFELKPTATNTLVEDSTKMFIRTRKEINLALELGEGVWPVNVDRNQIEQVLINLYVNAWQAMPEGGGLCIRTENIRLDEAYCRSFEVAGGDYVRISVSDTGIGMDARTMARIFEPFFTTKGIGKGTGLGLASAYGIVRNHKGIIRVESEPGQGTTFEVYLPAHLGDVSPEKVADAKRLPRGEGTILLADDDEEALLAESLMLEELGYEVVKAQGGLQAVHLYREDPTRFILVMLDMVMPGLSGRETYERLKLINPDVKILLISGYGLNQQVGEIMTQGCNGFLSKPFETNVLAGKLHEVLAKN
jgi:two-component system, cell cycle sensor histidine kinase and response regulator CckA